MAKLNASAAKDAASQTSFSMSLPIKSQVISRRRDFEALFKGFTRLRAISYVTSPDVLLAFFEEGYTDVELLVGENISEPQFRKGLEQKDRDIVERLIDLHENGKLRIFLPQHTVHTKLYILENAELTRIIISSANLTESAREASRQTNYAWHVDVIPSDPWLDRVNSDYQAHLKGCALFMDDLKDLLSQTHDVSRKELIDVWFKATPSDEPGAEVTEVMQEVTLKALESTDAKEIIVVRLPEGPAARKQVHKFFAPLTPIITSTQLQIHAGDYINFVEERHGLPLMRLDEHRSKVLLGMKGTLTTLTESLPGAQRLDECLGHVESYLSTVDLGQSQDPRFAKTAMFEALLYVLATPFAHEYMLSKRAAYHRSIGDCALDTEPPIC